MKNVILIMLFLCSFCVYVNAVTLTRYYTGQIDSYFERDGVVYSLSGTTNNGVVDKFDTNFPYAGGMVINRPAVMSSDAIQMGTIFINRQPFTIADCWASGFIQGYLEIEETTAYPIGTPLELQINYMIGEIGDLTGQYLDRGMALADQDFNPLWTAYQSTSGLIKTEFIQISAGTQYLFFMWQDLGTQYKPIPVEGSEVISSAVALDFSVIPEPYTLLLYGLGAMWMRRR